jgi:hypothetical protein
VAIPFSCPDSGSKPAALNPSIRRLFAVRIAGVIQIGTALIDKFIEEQDLHGRVLRDRAFVK